MVRRMAPAPPWEALTPQTKSKPHCGELCLLRGPPAKLWHIFYSIVCRNMRTNWIKLWCRTDIKEKVKGPPTDHLHHETHCSDLRKRQKGCQRLMSSVALVNSPGPSIYAIWQFWHQNLQNYRIYIVPKWFTLFYNGFRRLILFLILHHHLPSQPDGFCTQSKCQLSRCDLSRAHFCNCRQTLRDEIQSPLQMKRSFRISSGQIFWRRVALINSHSFFLARMCDIFLVGGVHSA